MAYDGEVDDKVASLGLATSTTDALYQQLNDYTTAVVKHARLPRVRSAEEQSAREDVEAELVELVNVIAVAITEAEDRARWITIRRVEVAVRGMSESGNS